MVANSVGVFSKGPRKPDLHYNICKGRRISETVCLDLMRSQKSLLVIYRTKNDPNHICIRSNLINKQSDLNLLQTFPNG